MVGVLVEREEGKARNTVNGQMPLYSTGQKEHVYGSSADSIFSKNTHRKSQKCKGTDFTNAMIRSLAST